MAEKDKDQQAQGEQAAEEQAAEEQPQAEGQAAEAPQPDEAGEQPDAKQPAAADEAGEEPATEAEAAAPAAEGGGEEALTPRAIRKRERARFTGTSGPQRTSAERAAHRVGERKRKATARRRWRQRRRERQLAAREGPASTARVPLARSEPGSRKVRQGVVVSSKQDKTITVRIDKVGRHRVYGKVLRQTSTLHAHDEQNRAAEGDLVRIVECRPLSRTKRWRLIEILERAR